MNSATQTENMQIVGTLIGQIRAQGIKGTLVYDAENMMVRVSQKRGGYVINSDVFYRPGLDLYDVTVYRIDMRVMVKGEFNERHADVVAQREFSGVYADMLPEVVGAWKA